MSLLEGIFKPIMGILNIFNSPFAVIIIFALCLLGVGGFYLYIQIKPTQRVLYFSEEEHRGEEFKVKRVTPAFLYSKKGKDEYRFIRFRDAYAFNIGMKNVSRWLGKKGTAYAKKLQSGKVGEFTLWNVMRSVWGDEVCNALVDEQKQKLIESEVMITVDLEEGTTPQGLKDRSEIYIKKESDEEMAKMFGLEVSKEFNKEDWIRTIALIGCGAALTYIAQAMGILAGVAT